MDAIRSQLGMVPNFLKVFANSPVALRAFLGLHGVANEGSLDPQTRERNALGLAHQNSCEYCLLENPARYLDMTSHTMTETDFLKQVAQHTGCSLVLDINNFYISACNLAINPRQ